MAAELPRFASVSSEEISQSTVKGRVLNSDVAAQTGLNAFSAWVVEKGFKDDLSTSSFERFEELIPQFLLEARKKDGSEYPAHSLKSYLVNFQRWLRENNAAFGPEGSFFASKSISTALDNRSKVLTAKGLATGNNQKDAFTEDEEELILACLDLNIPADLQLATLFNIAKNFGVRGGDELRDLKCYQFLEGSLLHEGLTRQFVEYDRLKTKNNLGDAASVTLRANSTKPRIFVTAGTADCSNLVYLLRAMTAARPSDFKDDSLFLRPKAKLSASGTGFDRKAVGEQWLKTFVRDLAIRAGLDNPQRFTNHSLKKTLITRMFDAGIDEKSVMLQSGNRSSKSLQQYRTGSLTSQLATSDAIATRERSSISSSAANSVLGKRALLSETEEVTSVDVAGRQSAFMSTGNSFSFGNISGGVIINIGQQQPARHSE
jgi:integrase